MPGEYLNHVNAVRYRILGTGNLKTKLMSLDNTQEIDLFPLVMQTQPNKYNTLLTNFVQQRMQLEFRVDEIDENFVMRDLRIYIKPISTSYPG